MDRRFQKVMVEPATPAETLEILTRIKEKYEEREKYLKKIIPRLKKILKRERIKILNINYRAKSYWSAYQKLAKYNMDFSKKIAFFLYLCKIMNKSLYLSISRQRS